MAVSVAKRKKVGRLFDKEVTTLGVTDKEKRGTGLKKEKVYNINLWDFLINYIIIRKIEVSV